MNKKALLIIIIAVAVPFSGQAGFMRSFLGGAPGMSRPTSTGGGLAGLMSTATQMGTGAMMAGTQASMIGAQMLLEKSRKIRTEVYGPFEKRDKTYQVLLKRLESSQKELFDFLDKNLTDILGSAVPEVSIEEPESEGISWSDDEWGEEESEGESEEDEEQEEKKEEPKVDVTGLVKQGRKRLKRFGRQHKIFCMYLERVVIGADNAQDDAQQKMPSLYDQPVAYQEDELMSFTSRAENIASSYVQRRKEVVTRLRALMQMGSMMCVMTPQMKKQRDKIPVDMMQAQQMMSGMSKMEALAMVAEWGKANIPKVLKPDFDPVAQAFYEAHTRLERAVEAMLMGSGAKSAIADREAAQQKMIALFDDICGVSSSAETDAGAADEEEDLYGGGEEEEDGDDFGDDDDADGDADEEKESAKKDAVDRDWGADIAQYKKLRKALSGAHKSMLIMLDRAIGRKKPPRVRARLVVKKDRAGYVAQYKKYKSAMVEAQQGLKEFALGLIGARIDKDGVKRYEGAKLALRQAQKEFLLFGKKLLISLRDAKKRAAEEKAKAEAARKAKEEAARKAEEEAKKAAEEAKKAAQAKENAKDDAIASALDNVDGIASTDDEEDAVDAVAASVDDIDLELDGDLSSEDDDE